MLSTLQIPAGYTLRIEVDRTMELDARVTVFRGDEWVGETSAHSTNLDQPGSLQQLVDHLTKRERPPAGLRLER